MGSGGARRSGWLAFISAIALTTGACAGAAEVAPATGPTIRVPDVVGQPLAEARAVLEAAGFSVEAVEVAGGPPAGRVVAQRPGAGADLTPGAAVVVEVAAAPSSTTLAASPPPSASSSTTTATTTMPPGTTAGPIGLTATTVFHNGPVIAEVRTGARVDALAVAGDRIVAVGASEDVWAYVGPETIVVDLQGRALLPGLVDAHAHWIGDSSRLDIEDGGEAAAFAASRGWTSIAELFTNQERLDALVALDLAGSLPIRVSAYLPVNFHGDHFGIWFDAYRPGQVLSPHVRIAGAKLFIDPASATFLLSEDHSNRPGYAGEVAWTQAGLDAMVADLHRGGWQIAIHTCGDGALDMVLEAYGKALGGEPNTLRHRIEHLSVVRDDQIAAIRHLGLVASIQLGWFESDFSGVEPWWQQFEEALGPDRIGWMGRWRDLLDGGVTVIGGTDTPYSGPDSFGGIAEAVTRVGGSGSPPEPEMLAQRIDVEEALHLVTTASAWGIGQEDSVGGLGVGKYADLVIVSDDPLSVPAEGLRDLRVLVTIVGGRTVFCADPVFCP